MTQSIGLNLPFTGGRDIAQATRDRIDRYAQEVGSGRVSDTGRALSSDFSGVSRQARSLVTLSAARDSLSEAATWGQALQASLGAIADANQRVVGALPSTFASGQVEGFELAAETAKGAAADMITALTQMVGGRSLFANGDTSPPQIVLDDMLADISGLARGAGSFDDYIGQVDAYFGPGGSYETTVVGALPAEAVRFPTGGTGSAAYELYAGAEDLRGALKQALLVAALPEAGFDLSDGAQNTVTLTLQQRSAQVGADLPNLQGRVGVVESRIETRSVAVDDAMLRAEMLIADSIQADPFEAATLLQEELSRLESLYAITARRSQLRLTNFL